MIFTRTAVDALMAYALCRDEQAVFDCGHPGIVTQLAADRTIVTLPPGSEKFRPQLANHTAADLESGVQNLILQVAQASPAIGPVDVNAYFHRLDLQFQVILIQGQIIAAPAPEFFGLLTRYENLSAASIFNSVAVRIDVNAPEYVPPPITIRSNSGAKAKRKNMYRAQVKARALLFRFLTRAQKWELRAHGRFTVLGQDGLTYRIYHKSHGNVKLVEEDRETQSICVIPHPSGEILPVPDLLLAQKVYLENDITTFLGMANVTPIVADRAPAEYARRLEPPMTRLEASRNLFRAWHERLRTAAEPDPTLAYP